MSPNSSLKKIASGAIAVIAVAISLGMGSLASAQNPVITDAPTSGFSGSGTIQGNLDEISESIYGQDVTTRQSSLPALIGQYINVFLGLLGIVFVLYTIYAGFLYFNSQGDPKKTGDARAIIQNCIIGLIIIFAAYAISNFVIGAILEGSGVSGV